MPNSWPLNCGPEKILVDEDVTEKAVRLANLFAGILNLDTSNSEILVLKSEIAAGAFTPENELLKLKNCCVKNGI